jgi:hypothetical protein
MNKALKEFLDNVSDMLDHTHGDIFNDMAYTTAARLSSNHPVIFIDPDKITAEMPLQRLRQLADHLDEQVPGAAEAVAERLDGVFGFASTSFDIESLWALNNVMIDGKEYGVITMPLEEDRDIENDLAIFLGIRDSETYYGIDKDQVIANFDITNLQMSIANGAHEGSHINKGSDDYELSATLREETRADRIALSYIGFDESAVLSWKDLRHLTADLGGGSHATGIFLSNDLEVTDQHMIAAANFKWRMHDAVTNEMNNGNYYLTGGTALTSEELLETDPDKFFELYHKDKEQSFKSIEELVQGHNVAFYEDESQAIEAANKLEVLSKEKTIVYFIQIENYHHAYAHHFEGAFRRRVLGQDYPETEPELFAIPDKMKNIDERIEQALNDSSSGYELLNVEALENERYINDDWLTDGSIEASSIKDTFDASSHGLPIRPFDEIRIPELTTSPSPVFAPAPGR